MKSGWKIAGCMVLMALCGCSDSPEEFRSSVELRFDPAIRPLTRSSEGIYPEQTPFGVWCYALDTEKSWNESSSEAELWLDGEQISHQATGWGPAEPCLWSPDKRLTVAAWSPYALEVGFTPTTGITLTDFDLTESEIRPLYSELQSDLVQPKEGGAVALGFYHALAQVEFRANTTLDPEMVMRVKGIRMGELACAGDFQSLPQPTWQPNEKRIDVEWCTTPCNLSQSSQAIGTALWVLPQKLNHSVEILYDLCYPSGEVMFSDQLLKSDRMTGTWRSGRSYCYTLTLSQDRVAFTTETLKEL